MTQTESGRVFVRYLPAGTPAGSEKAYPFVATFPVANAFAATKSAASESGTVKLRVDGGAVAFYSSSSPENIYLAFPGSRYQIEVFDPDPARGRRLVEGGRVVPVSLSAPGAVNGSQVTRATPARLRRLPAELGHPVYWVGPRQDVTYELTRTASGRVFIRYLPPGMSLGSEQPAPFVATFPVANAFGVTKEVAERPDSMQVALGGGAIAFYSKPDPKVIYLAYPGSKFQIEVFAPTGAQALELAKQVRPIR